MTTAFLDTVCRRCTEHRGRIRGHYKRIGDRAIVSGRTPLTSLGWGCLSNELATSSSVFVNNTMPYPSYDENWRHQVQRRGASTADSTIRRKSTPQELKIDCHRLVFIIGLVNELYYDPSGSERE